MQYILLKKKQGLSPRPCTILSTPDFLSLCETAKGKKGFVHIDFETNGLEAHHFPDIGIESIGMAAADIAPVAVDVRLWSSDEWRNFLSLLYSRGWIAYNMAFDGAHLYNMARELSRPHPQAEDDLSWEEPYLASMKGCSLTLFRHLTNDGVKGMRHSLEAAIENYLGWEEIANQKAWLADATARHRLKKSEMHKLLDLEREAFLSYNAMDAEASFQVWECLVADIKARKWEAVGKFHMNEGMEQVRELIVQQHHGILIDRDRMAKYKEELATKLQKAEGEFRTHPKIKPLIETWEEFALNKFYETRLQVKHIYAKKKDMEAGLLPSSDEEVTTEEADVEAVPMDKEWMFLPKPAADCPTAWEREAGGRYYKRAVSITVKNKNKSPPKFNMASPAHMQWLLFTGPNALFKYEIKDESWEDASGRKVEAFVGVVYVPQEDGSLLDVEVPLTGKGDMPTGKDVAPALGDIGALMMKHSKLEQELAYVVAYLEASSRTGRVHPQFKPHGTATGRLSATGGTNLQQVPKTEGFLSCFIARPGCKLVDFDLNSIEPTIQAEFSKDKTMMELYASGKPHDVYLFFARGMHPNPEFRKALSQRYTPEAEVIDVLKKEFKKERTFIKSPILGQNYGMGAKKLKRQLGVSGFPVSLEEAQYMKDAYWAQLGGLVSWYEKLKQERRARKGFVMSAFGHPLAIPDNYEKDTPNRFTQNSGHAVLMMLNCIVRRKCLAAGITGRIRPIIQDFHDERIVEVPEELVDTYLTICKESIDELNKKLGGTIPIKIGPDVGDNIWKFKS